MTAKTTLEELRGNIRSVIKSSRGYDGQLRYDHVIDVLSIEASVAVAEQLRMANLIAISNKMAYSGDLALHREIDDYVRQECGDWEADDKDD